MKLSTRDTTFFALLLASLIAGGYALYIISKTLPIPGMKYVIMSPYFSLVLMVLMGRVPRKGAILLFNAGFGGIMGVISPVMSLAIITTGAMTEAVFLATRFMTNKNSQHILTAASYSSFAVLTSILFAYWLTYVPIYEMLGPIGTALLSAAAFVLGILGAWAGLLIRDRIYGRS